MTWLPRTLFGRNALLIAVLLVAGQLLSTALVRELILKPRLELIADGLARNVSGIRAGLAALPQDQRASFVNRFNQRALADLGGQATDTDGPLGRRLRVLLTPLERSLVASASRRIAQDGGQIIWRREAGGSLAVRLALDGTDHWIVLPGVLPAHEFTGAWVTATLAAIALAMVGAMLMQRRLNRPLQQVVQAAQSLARGNSPTPLPEDGPEETATLARSINQLTTSLARADQERALMLAGVSHDLRTPLTRLRLGLEILGTQHEPEISAGMARSIDEMDTIVGQFLDFARAGDHSLPLQPGDLDALVRDVASAAASHGQALQLTLGSPPPVPMQAQALRRAIVNLVENAYRHGKPPVSISTGCANGSVWLTVGDRGNGIAPAQAEALKQPFRRAGDARTGPAGAGLGLAIVDRVAKGHGGRLDLLAQDGGGLLARLSWPA